MHEYIFIFCTGGGRYHCWSRGNFNLSCSVGSLESIFFFFRGKECQKAQNWYSLHGRPPHGAMLYFEHWQSKILLWLSRRNSIISTRALISPWRVWLLLWGHWYEAYSIWSSQVWVRLWAVNVIYQISFEQEVDGQTSTVRRHSSVHSSIDVLSSQILRCPKFDRKPSHAAAEPDKADLYLEDTREPLKMEDGRRAHIKWTH